MLCPGYGAGPIAWLLHLVDESIVTEGQSEGRSSGEGLIGQVRDPISANERQGRGADRQTEEVLSELGVSDKRLWVPESEFASMAKMAQREGNAVAAMVRHASEDAEGHGRAVMGV